MSSQAAPTRPSRPSNRLDRKAPERTVLRTVARALSLCAVRDRVEAESHATGKALLAFGGQRMELGGVHVP